MTITIEERNYLRELAKKQLEYSKLPIMAQRQKQWINNNDLNGKVPTIHFESYTCEGDLLPQLKCTTEAARNIELQFFQEMLNHEMIDDDRVIPSWFRLQWDIKRTLFDIEIKQSHSKDSHGRDIGHKFLYPITDLEKELHSLQPTTFSVDRQKTLEYKAFLEDIFGDILPVKLEMSSLGACLSQDVVHLMGMEAMIYAIVDYPDEFHALMRKITDDYLRYFKWLEQENLLMLNNGNNFLGNGSFGFSNNLPKKDYAADKPVHIEDVWLFMDSQETVSISPNMYGEFFFPYYNEVASGCGLLSYGCCEPVHSIWKDYVSKFKNIRKVSVSPWCNEQQIGEFLKGSSTIYHRKPSPNHVGVGKVLDEEAFRADIIKTAKAAQGCKLEVSFRDVYSLEGDNTKPRRAVKITREVIEEFWK